VAVVSFVASFAVEEADVVAAAAALVVVVAFDT